MRVAFGSDHAGFELKERLERTLEGWGHEVEDLGTHSMEPVDYPPFCFATAERVARGAADRGVVLGGSGIGEAIAANKVVGIRAAVVTSEQTLPRESLYAAEELFFSGTAVEVSPIGSLDRIPIGNGGRGPVTRQIQEAYFDAVRGKNPKHRDWLTPVRAAGPAATPAPPPVAAAARPS